MVEIPCRTDQNTVDIQAKTQEMKAKHRRKLNLSVALKSKSEIINTSNSGFVSNRDVTLGY